MFNRFNNIHVVLIPFGLQLSHIKYSLSRNDNRMKYFETTAPELYFLTFQIYGHT